MKLKDARKTAKLTQEQVARAADITLSYYRLVEQKKSIPTVIVARLICDTLGINLYDVDEWQPH